MIFYSVIMFAVAFILIVVSAYIYRGKTELIHDYHQSQVTDKAGYGKSMGKALAGISVPLIAAGIIGMFNTSVLPTLVLIIGLIISFIPIIIIQKKYNGGLF